MSRRSAGQSSTKRLRSKGKLQSGFTLDSVNNVYSASANTTRPYSAPKVQKAPRGMSASRKRPRVQSGRVKQIKQYLSEQEAAHLHMQQQIMLQNERAMAASEMVQEGQNDDEEEGIAEEGLDEGGQPHDDNSDEGVYVNEHQQQEQRQQLEDG